MLAASRVTTAPVRFRCAMVGASSGISLVLASISRWAADPPGAGVEDGQQVHLAAVRADRAADGLAVGGGLRQQAGHGGLLCRPGGASLLPFVPGHVRAGRQRCEVAIQRRVERLSVDLFEDPRERARAGRPDRPGPRVAPPAERGQGLLRAPGRPFSDRDCLLMPGRGVCARHQGQHELQPMPAAGPGPLIRDPGRPLAQAVPRGIFSGDSPGQVARWDAGQGR